MELAPSIKNKNKPSAKYDGSDPLPDIAAVAIAIVPENKNNIFESIIINHKRKIVPPDGNIVAMEEDAALKKHNTSSEKDDESAPIGISVMADSAVLQKHYSKAQSSVEMNKELNVPHT